MANIDPKTIYAKFGHGAENCNPAPPCADKARRERKRLDLTRGPYSQIWRAGPSLSGQQEGPLLTRNLDDGNGLHRRDGMPHRENPPPLCSST